MFLERIASEMNNLKFYIVHAQNMPFIENMEKRIHNATLLLETCLGHCFVDGVENRDANSIYNCLRAYAAIDNANGPEEIYLSTVVAPFVQMVIPHRSSRAVGMSSTDDLEQEYEWIKQYIRDDCKFLLDISFTENSGLHVFSFLANSILKEVLSAIKTRKPGAFSPVRPAQFLQYYKSSLDFLAYLEGYCPTRSAVVKLRAEAVYIEFMKQWNSGIYFSLRFQEIAGALDSELMITSLVPSQNATKNQQNSQNLLLRQSISLMDCLRSCWADDVLVLSCSDKFLRLFLQLLSRYSSWLSAGLNARRARNTSPNTEWAISAAPDDFIYWLSVLQIPRWCCLCKNNLETQDHLLLHCDFSKGIWIKVIQHLQFQWSFPRTAKDMLLMEQSFIQGKDFSDFWQIVIQCVFWKIWLQRNRRIFEEKQESETEIWEQIRFRVATWALNLKKFQHLRMLDLIRDWRFICS